jgi:hypothetical protein
MQMQIEAVPAMDVFLELGLGLLFSMLKLLSKASQKTSA